MNSREELIEEAAKAIADVQNVPFVGPKQRKLAEAALAVFEKANKSTADDRAQGDRRDAAQALRDIGRADDGA